MNTLAFVNFLLVKIFHSQNFVPYSSKLSMCFEILLNYDWKECVNTLMHTVQIKTTVLLSYFSNAFISMYHQAAQSCEQHYCYQKYYAL